MISPTSSSANGFAFFQQALAQKNLQQQNTDSTDSLSANSEQSKSSNTNKTSPKDESSEINKLSEEDEKKLEKLKERDREVRQHEQAHLTAAGQHANGGAIFDYEKGPDGRNYAVGGRVNINTSAISGDPEATLRKAEQLKRAALAPHSPSAKDREVAAQASRMELKAQQELREDKQDLKESKKPDDLTNNSVENQNTTSRNTINTSQINISKLNSSYGAISQQATAQQISAFI
ncbi:MAG: hypothetical protein HN826_04680 [Methylococcales bacterium]|jgi:hypothetical protein|nr:hypothetical protein [Methylococcales bacterium]